MSSAALPGRRPFVATVLMGVWAAAIALAPDVVWKAALVAPAIALPAVWWTLHRPARWLAVFWAASLLLPPLPIPIGDSGPHPCLAVAALGLLCGFVYFDDWRFALSGLNASLIALFGA